MSKTVAFSTLGCKVNQYESEAVLEQFIRAGYRLVSFSEAADVYVINTCTVTHLSDRKSRQMIRRAKQLNPDAVLAVMGCYAQTDPESVMKIAGVDIIIGTTNRIQMVWAVEEFIRTRNMVNLVQDLGNDSCFEALTIDGTGQEHTRAFLKVQDGCNQFCSYCIIPYARGRIRSRSVEDTVSEAKRISEAGFTELVLTGIHLASWGKDSGEGNLLDLLQALDSVPGIRRIRLGSLEPTLCDELFVRGLCRLKKVCHHFHLSLQSGSDRTLKRMNRKYTAEEYAAAVERIRTAMPDAAFTTDVIVGFPGETETDFEDSYSFVKSLGLSDAHIFKYSPRKGTPAAKMENQISPEVKEERSRRFLELTAENQQRFLESYIGKVEEVLFEQSVRPGVYEGKTRNYLAVYAKSERDLTGLYLDVRLVRCENGILEGEIL